MLTFPDNLYAGKNWEHNEKQNGSRKIVLRDLNGPGYKF